MAGVIEYIDNKLVKPGSYERQWTEIRDAYNRKLWHQLTILVEKLVKDPEFRHEHNLFELTHDIVDALRKSPEKGWLIDLLEAFSHGELEKISALKAKWSKEPDLSSCVDKIEEKATVLCLIELIFVRPANNRTISFKEIAEATNCAVRDVEHLLMRALSLKLIRGRIDEVNQTVNITWLQPRVLDNHQIGSMNKRLKTWCSSVSDMKDFIEVDAKAIIA